MATSTQPEQEREKEFLRADASTTSYTPVQPALSARENTAGGRAESRFGPGVIIEGRIEGSADVRIGGVFKGNIQIAGAVTIEKGAHVAAKIHAAHVNIAGEVEGNVAASSQVRLLESGQLIGDLKAATLTVAAGSRMRGHVEFGWSSAETAKLSGGRAGATDKGKSSG